MNLNAKLVVFDLDGTLLDSMTGFSRVAAEVISRYFGISPLVAKQMYLKTSGLPFEHQLQTMFPGNPLLAQAVSDYESQKISGYNEIPFFADVVPTLQILKQQGLRVAISSNNHYDNVAAKVSPLVAQLDHILGYRPGFLKGIAHFEYLMKKEKLDNSDLLFVGDSLHDARMSFACQISFVAKLGTFQIQDFQEVFPACSSISKIAELLSLLSLEASVSAV